MVRARARAAKRDFERVRRRLGGVPAARAVFVDAVRGLEALRPLGIVVLGSLRPGGRRPDARSDLDLGVVLRDRRRLVTFRRRVPAVLAGCGELIAAATGPGAEQWIGLIVREGAAVKVDVHLATVGALRTAPPWTAVFDPEGGLPPPRPVQAGTDPTAATRAALLAFAAWTRVHRGDPLEAASLLARARDALAPALRDALDLPPGGVRGLWQAADAGPRRRLAATLPRGFGAAELRRATRALLRLARACGAAPIEDRL